MRNWILGKRKIIDSRVMRLKKKNSIQSRKEANPLHEIEMHQPTWKHKIDRKKRSWIEGFECLCSAVHIIQFYFLISVQRTYIILKQYILNECKSSRKMWKEETGADEEWEHERVTRNIEYKTLRRVLYIFIIDSSVFIYWVIQRGSLFCFQSQYGQESSHWRGSFF